MTIGNVAAAVQGIATLLLGLLALWFTRVQTQVKIGEHRDRLHDRFAEVSGAIWDLFATVAVSTQVDDYMASMTRAAKAGATGRWIIGPGFKDQMERFMGAAREYWGLRNREPQPSEDECKTAMDTLFDHRDRLLAAVDKAAMLPAVDESPVDSLRQVFGKGLLGRWLGGK
jgi:hypothetical protein